MHVSEICVFFVCLFPGFCMKQQALRGAAQGFAKIGKGRGRYRGAASSLSSARILRMYDVQSATRTASLRQ
jgi:hypothetical protein